MAQTVTVPSSIDDSSKLQKLIDSKGNTPSTYVFSEGQHIEINSLLRVYNYTEFNGNGCKFTLMDNAPVATFGVQVPCIAPKLKTGATGLNFHHFSFDGNYKTQKYSIAASGTDHGKGYHNFIGAGNSSDPKITGLTNSSFHDLDLGYNQGDEFRIEGGANLKIWNITSSMGGHDVIHLSTVHNSEIWNCKVDMRANNLIRVRNGNNIKIHDCEGNGATNLAWSPAIQIESISANRHTENIEIYNNYIHDTYGPGIWLAGNVPGNTSVNIHHNLILRCGKMPKENGIPGVGGIVYDGFDNVLIKNNRIIDSYGYGILAGSYQLTSPYKGKATITKNIITRTHKSFTEGKESGSAIANLTSTRNTMECYENCLWSNINDLYQVTQSAGIYKDPLFTSDYNLQVNSPCINLGFDAKMDDTMIDTTVNYRRWSTLYAEYDDATTVQETVVIKGEAGKQIHLTNIALRLKTSKAGNTAYARVVIAGFKDTDFEENMITYKDHSQAVNFLAPVGADMTLKFHLKTSSKAIRAYMEVLRYSYELVDPVEQDVIRVGDTIEIVIQRDNGTEKLVGVIEKKS